MQKLHQLTVCVDLHGCPNRCRHCWLGVTPNGNLGEKDLRFAAAAFRPFTDNLEVSDWYREPDFSPRYKEMWELAKKLSDSKAPHFELISIWRAARDPEYVPWLYSLGVRAAQLTLFGDEETTDYFFGRKGAYQEILQTIDRLVENGIAPRIQTFIYKKNIAQLPHILGPIEQLELEKRCAGIGQELGFFLHQGSCDGESEKLYDVWITPEEIALIPEKLIEFTLRHFNKPSIKDVLGSTEKQLCAELSRDDSTENLAGKEPVFYVDRNFDVFPNIETPSAFYRLGNLKSDGAEQILESYINNRSAAQHTRLTVPISRMAGKYGDPESMRLFGKRDYQYYLLNRCCRATAE